MVCVGYGGVHVTGYDWDNQLVEGRCSRRKHEEEQSLLPGLGDMMIRGEDTGELTSVV